MAENVTIAFSSQMVTGWREENASKKDCFGTAEGIDKGQNREED
jgi:hypothetical protein